MIICSFRRFSIPCSTFMKETVPLSHAIHLKTPYLQFPHLNQISSIFSSSTDVRSFERTSDLVIFHFLIEIFIDILNLQESIIQALNLFSSLNNYNGLITWVGPKCQNIYFSFYIHHLLKTNKFLKCCHLLSILLHHSMTGKVWTGK